MRVGVDANISGRIVRMLAALYPNHSFETVGAGKAESDAPWLDEFAADGGEILLGLDRRIMTRPHEVEALEKSNLFSCFFDFSQSAKLNTQAAFFAYLSPFLVKLWEEEDAPRVLRYDARVRLDTDGLAAMEFWRDNGVPRVRKIAIK